MLELQAGMLPVIHIEADTIGEGWEKAVIACYQQGFQVKTPKHPESAPLGYDADITVVINDPLSRLVHRKGICGSPEDLYDYLLEVKNGIYDEWVGHGWDYTYHGRLVDQIQPMIERMKKDYFGEKGRFGRDYQMITWIPEIDQVIEDPPCLQRMHFRLLKPAEDSEYDYLLNLSTDWRSRDLMKAWLMNAFAICDWFRWFAKRLSEELDLNIGVGRYRDDSNSLHVYGTYVQEGIENLIQGLITYPWPGYNPITGKPNAILAEDYLIDGNMYGYSTVSELYHFIAAQLDCFRKYDEKKQPPDRLVKLGYDILNFPYPPEWDD